MLYLISKTFRHAVVTFTIIIVSYVFVIKTHYYGKNVNNTFVEMSEYSTCFSDSWNNLLGNLPAVPTASLDRVLS